jgi:predicted PurR-regulated permease PerM
MQPVWLASLLNFFESQIGMQSASGTCDVGTTNIARSGEKQDLDWPAPINPVRVRSIAFSILSIIAGIFLLRFAEDLFVPAILSMLIAFALNPIVNLVQRLRLPRAAAAAIVLIALLSGTGMGLYALRFQFVAVIESIPEVTQKLRQKIDSFQRGPRNENGTLGKLQQAAAELEKTAAEAAGATKAPSKGVTKVQIDEPAFRASDFLWFGSVGFLSLLGKAIMVSFLVFFILASGDLFKRKLVRVIGTRLSQKRVTLEALNEINGQIERFLLIQLLTGVLVGLCTTMALWAFGVSQPAVWGLAAGIFNSVPYFGAIIVTCGLALVAFLQFGSVVTALQIAGVALAITGIEGSLLTPALMGRAARINGVAMFLSLLFWTWVWGVIGTIVAVPLMMVLKSICDRIESFQPIGELLGEQ